MSEIVEEGAELGQRLLAQCDAAIGRVDPMGLGTAAADLVRPSALAAEVPTATLELIRIGLGMSEVEFSEADPRFADPTWRTNPLYRRLGQTYRLLEQTVGRVVERSGDRGWRRQERARLLADILTGAAAPVNVLPGNPAAMKRVLETGGRSVAWGLRNMARDVFTNGAMPRMVDTRPFTVGTDVACTPGAVVHREEMFEVLQYTPSTSMVRERPLLMVPPQLNRHYIVDLAPGRSLVEYALA